jgi:hypothetical protein
MQAMRYSHIQYASLESNWLGHVVGGSVQPGRVRQVLQSHYPNPRCRCRSSYQMVLEGPFLSSARAKNHEERVTLRRSPRLD